MGIVINQEKVAGIIINQEKVAGKAFNGEIIYRSRGINLGRFASKILNNCKLITVKPDFSIIATDSNTNIYQDEDNDGNTYYFRGASKNNYVSFAGFYWRIIRINGNGSVRLIYDGKQPYENGTIGEVASNTVYNTVANDNSYVGYMHGLNNSGTSTSYEQAHANNYNSTIKDELENWYYNNIGSLYYDYIEENAGFCNDRKIESIVQGPGYGNHVTSYSAYTRLVTYKTPSFKYENTDDLFTPSTSNKGNRKLSQEVGLITADEVVFAGGTWQKANNQFYLYNGQNYWTMTPSNFIANEAGVFGVYKGNFGYSNVDSSSGIRPVINLKGDLDVAGEGTYNNPYIVS